MMIEAIASGWMTEVLHWVGALKVVGVCVILFVTISLVRKIFSPQRMIKLDFDYRDTA